MSRPEGIRVLRFLMMERWKKHFSHLSDLGLAPIQHNPLRGNAFVDITIEDHRFRGLVTQHGPCVWGATRHGGNCPLGVASIQYREAYGGGWKDRAWSSTRFWQVCKHHHQSRIDLSDLSDRGRRALAVHFGMPMLDIGINAIDDYIRPVDLAFYVSPAFASLADWAKTHPRRIKKAVANAALSNWPKAAVSRRYEDAGLPTRLTWRPETTLPVIVA